MKSKKTVRVKKPGRANVKFRTEWREYRQSVNYRRKGNPIENIERSCIFTLKGFNINNPGCSETKPGD